MDVFDLVEMALAKVDPHRVEVVTLEPAEISREVVGGASELVFELVDNALDLSDPDEPVRIEGSFLDDAYRISVSHGGAGLSPQLVDALNRLLQDPGEGRDREMTVGILFVARLAARHGLTVRWSTDGTARVVLPADLVSRVEPGGEPVPSSRAGLWEEPEDDPGPILFHPETLRQETEDFLEKVFMGEWDDADELSMAVLWAGPAPEAEAVADGDEVDVFRSVAERQATEDFLGRLFLGESGEGEQVAPSPSASVGLRVRVPGEHFAGREDDSPSTSPGEAAVDIRKALTTYDEGRRSAGQGGP